MVEVDVMNVPQADDIEKILDIPLAISDRLNTKTKAIARYHFDARQADYYFEAVELLGMIKQKMGVYNLTLDGKKYRRMDPVQQKLMIIRKMLSLPIVTLIISELIIRPRHTISRDEIECLIEEHAGIHGTTVRRRAQTLLTWLRWIGDQTSSLSVEIDQVNLNVAPS